MLLLKNWNFLFFRRATILLKVHGARSKEICRLPALMLPTLENQSNRKPCTWSSISWRRQAINEWRKPESLKKTVAMNTCPWVLPRRNFISIFALKSLDWIFALMTKSQVMTNLNLLVSLPPPQDTKYLCKSDFYLFSIIAKRKKLQKVKLGTADHAEKMRAVDKLGMVPSSCYLP